MDRMLNEYIERQVINAIVEHTTTQRDRDEYRCRTNIQNAVENGDVDAVELLDCVFSIMKRYGMSFVEFANELFGEDGYEDESDMYME